MRPRDNRDHLVRVPARFRVAHAQLWTDRPMVDAAGRLTQLPGSGGVVPGLHTGMPVDALLADHIVPGISLEDDTAPAHALACIGNRVRDVTGATVGVVSGKRGGLAPNALSGQFLGVETPDEVLGQAIPGTPMIVESAGRGLALLDWPNIAVVNCSPRTLDALDPQEDVGALSVAVRAEIPGSVAGAGLGTDPWIGDLEIAAETPAAAALCFGDLIAFRDIDARHSRFFHAGYVAIGVVSHGPSPVPGHGTGVTILLSGISDCLRIRTDPDASLAPSLLAWSREEGER